MLTCLRGCQDCVHNRNNNTDYFQCLPVVKGSLICNLLDRRSIDLAGSRYLRSPTTQVQRQMSRVWAQRFVRSFKAMALCTIRTQRRQITVVGCVHMHTTRLSIRTRLMCPGSHDTQVA
jgi:hypothetical protein